MLRSIFLTRDQLYHEFIVRLLTSDELASEWNRIKDAEAGLSTNGEAVLLLVKANVADFLRFASLLGCH